MPIRSLSATDEYNLVALEEFHISYLSETSRYHPRRSSSLHPQPATSQGLFSMRMGASRKRPHGTTWIHSHLKTQSTRIDGWRSGFARTGKGRPTNMAGGPEVLSVRSSGFVNIQALTSALCTHSCGWKDRLYPFVTLCCQIVGVTQPVTDTTC